MIKQNVNTLWAATLVEVLARLGLQTAIACPGSRSTPLTVAVAQHPTVEAIPVLDERSAAFFALGLARRAGRPVVLICTSGTAGANFYPAVIEARESRIPLIVITADRPPELRDCNAGQTIDQQKLYGTFPNWYSELALPEANLDRLAYLRQTLIHAWERSLFPVAGPVHLNQPFRDPLAPISQPDLPPFIETFIKTWDLNTFVQHIDPQLPNQIPMSDGVPMLPRWRTWLQTWQTTRRGIILAGVAQSGNPEVYCGAIASLSHQLGFPVLAEGLSPARNYADLIPTLVAGYDWILRNPRWAEKLAPEIVIRVGEMPTSKVLRQWLTQHQPLQWVIDPGDRNLDPLHLPTQHWRITVEQLAKILANHQPDPQPANFAVRKAELSQQWSLLDREIWLQIAQRCQTQVPFMSGQVSWLLSRTLPPQTPIFIANSLAVREVEWFWQPGQRHCIPYFNRGANGIDGTLSTALGTLHRYQSGILLTGDLALLHDTNGFLLRSHFQGHLTIVLINNSGGGIFELLAIAQFDPPFEEFFATPQSVDIAQLCAAYQVEHQVIQSPDQFTELLNPLPTEGIRVLEIRCDRKQDQEWRQTGWQIIPAQLT